ncbi:PoNe immunity protein domain-containing protein [Bacillus manliponensis]|uniref:PoNe immunity protein domain-containing protein n=1 Tax=Bacillus manliponensis TaxID=574376 RepID=UPI0035198341
MREEFWRSDLYEDMLWMLSISVMLEVDKNTFDILVNLVKKSKIKLDDFLYKFSLIGM